MKLNLDAARDLMLYLEERLPLPSVGYAELDPANFDDDTIYAAMKLIEAGYLEGKTHSYLDGSLSVVIKSITWTGHEFLDHIRPKTPWEKAKEVASNVGGTSLTVIADIAAKISAELINKQLGH